MKRILVCGAGKIGSLIALLLSQTENYEVVLADTDFSGADMRRLQENAVDISLRQLDISDERQIRDLFAAQNFDAVISCLPYFLTLHAAKIAKAYQCHYFDLIEDMAIKQEIRAMAQDAATAFVPQCGLAPGMIGIIAHSLMQNFSAVESVKMRVGALPQYSSHALKYALTWSTDGLINEYLNNCEVLEQGRVLTRHALEDVETLEIDGAHYEAFNTSGGLGGLAELCQGKVRQMNYKTIRYSGHCEKIRFLLRDLKLAEDRATLKTLLEKALPRTYQDVVLIYVSVTGMRQGAYVEENYLRKIYPQRIDGMSWGAIQVATSTGLLSVMDSVLKNPTAYQGFIYQEQISLQDVIESPFGQYYSHSNGSELQKGSF